MKPTSFHRGAFLFPSFDVSLNKKLQIQKDAGTSNDVLLK